MGLKTTNYTVRDLGLIIPTAYARLAYVNVDEEGRASGSFAIHLNREDFMERKPIEVIPYEYIIDKNQPIYTQIYEHGKIQYFSGWEDDIVEEEPLEADPQMEIEEE